MPVSHYDVIIIGSGAGGGTLAHKLAPTGKKILILERGGYVPREKDNWSPRAVNLDGKYQTKEKWHDKDGNELHPHTNYYVGGNTKFFGAALFRLRKEDFGEIRHHGGLSPAWPITHDDLEPYYTKAERLYHVHGNRGEDPTEPPARSCYPHPAVSHEPRLQQLSDDFQSLGLRPFHTPLGVMHDERNPHASKCIRCGTCDGFPCLISAKSDAQVCAVDPALKNPNVTLMTDAYVERLETDASGRAVQSIVIRRNGDREELSADIVVISCGAINSAALLLRSANDKQPHGLANRADIVGRHYMGHVNSVWMARTRVVRMKLGEEAIELTQYLASEGRPIPADWRSNDRWFQHIAIVVSDMDKAYRHLRSHKVGTLRRARRRYRRPTKPPPAFALSTSKITTAIILRSFTFLPVKEIRAGSETVTVCSWASIIRRSSWRARRKV
jgi:choline dehydrogenase-like flavoprotein